MAMAIDQTAFQVAPRRARPESGQPYLYVRENRLEPDWRRFPGWRDVTQEDWESAQ